MAKLEHDLLIHPRTELQLSNYLDRAAQTMLLIGPAGSGKYTLAKTLAANLLGLQSINHLAAYPYYLELTTAEAKQEIPIDDVRSVIAKLRLKAPGKDGIRRLVLVDGADSLSQEAQNAFLKTLEEPAPDTVFILTAPSVRSIAPTIASRAQQLTVQPVTEAGAQNFYAGQFAKPEITSNWLLSGGAAGLLDSMLKNKADHPLKDAVASFKTFLGMDTYRRVLYCDQLSKDKLNLGYFLAGGKRVLAALHQHSIKTGHDRQAAKLGKSRKLLNDLQRKLDSNGNTKLVALSLALNLKL